ncbi:protein kinase domain-containing protein [Micromonospora fiedleri]|nr:RICIN domain-containing protein [Micromonospora fiedleri]
MSPPLITDRYVFSELLGQGGMGRVWKARDVMLERDVAIKEIVSPPGLTDQARQELRTRSLREARAIARLDHVNAVRVFDVLIGDGGDPWIVMEYVPSRAFSDHLAADGPVSPARAAQIGLAVLGALRAAHRVGVVHRDVKPANILIGVDGRVVLTDFGLATAVEDTSLTRTGIVLGSPAYLSPERVRRGAAGPEGDLWSLGATLFAAVEGEAPYARSSSLESLTALATEPPPVARRAGALAPVLEGLLRKDPAERMDIDTAERLLTQVAHTDLPHPSGSSARPDPSALAGPSTQVGPSVGDSSADRMVPTFVTVAPAGPAEPQETRDDLPTGQVLRAGVPDGPDPRPEKDLSAAPAPSAAPTRSVRMTRGRWLVGGLALLLVSLGVGVGVPLLGDRAGERGDDLPEAAGGPEPPLAATGVSAPSAPAATPLAWSTYRDDSGFRMVAPRGWRIVRDDGQVEFREPDEGRSLVVRRSDPPPTDPVAELTAQERAAEGRYPGYRLLRIGAVHYQHGAADWEWRHTTDGRATQVRQRLFVTGAGKAYTFIWSTPEELWAGSEAAFARIVDGFRPTGDPRPVTSSPATPSASPSPTPSAASASPPSTAPTVTPSSARPRTSGERIVSVASGRCLDVGDPDSAATLHVRIMDCADSRDRSQRWSVRTDGSMRMGSRCLDVANASTADGAVIQLTACNGGAAQRFTLNGDRQLVNALSGKCLDVTDWGTENGTPVQQWTCNNTASHQRWSIR